MPRLSNVTLNHIRAAIEQLEADGKPVTVRNAMAITGGTTADVSEMIKMVQDNRAAVRRAMAVLNPNVFAVINQEVDAHVALHVKSYKDELENHEGRFAEFHEFLREAEIKKSEDESTIDTLSQDLAAAITKAEEDRRQAAAVLSARDEQLRAKNSELAQVRQELSDATTEMVRLQHLDTTVAGLKQERDNAENARRAAEARAERAETRLEERQLPTNIKLDTLKGGEEKPSRK